MFVLQDWVTVSLFAGASISQSHSSYLELPENDDIVLYIDLRGTSLVGTMAFQTSPSGDSGSFVNLAPALTLPTNPTFMITRFLAGYTPVPLARFLRWTLLSTGGSAGYLTFRVLVAAYAPG